MSCITRHTEPLGEITTRSWASRAAWAWMARPAHGRAAAEGGGGEIGNDDVRAGGDGGVEPIVGLVLVGQVDLGRQRDDDGRARWQLITHSLAAPSR
jgi:hypothetical protein